jgi:ribosomal small subunit protein bTHX
MGKGDKKTAKGKRAMGSYGKTRKRKEDAPIVVVKKEKKEKPQPPRNRPPKKRPQKNLNDSKSCLRSSFFLQLCNALATINQLL